MPGDASPPPSPGSRRSPRPGPGDDLAQLSPGSGRVRGELEVGECGENAGGGGSSGFGRVLEVDGCGKENVGGGDLDLRVESGEYCNGSSGGGVGRVLSGEGMNCNGNLVDESRFGNGVTEKLSFDTISGGGIGKVLIGEGMDCNWNSEDQRRFSNGVTENLSMDTESGGGIGRVLNSEGTDCNGNMEDQMRFSDGVRENLLDTKSCGGVGRVLNGEVTDCNGNSEDQRRFGHGVTDNLSLDTKSGGGVGRVFNGEGTHCHGNSEDQRRFGDGVTEKLSFGMKLGGGIGRNLNGEGMDCNGNLEDQRRVGDGVTENLSLDTKSGGGIFKDQSVLVNGESECLYANGNSNSLKRSSSEDGSSYDQQTSCVADCRSKCLKSTVLQNAGSNFIQSSMEKGGLNFIKRGSLENGSSDCVEIDLVQKDNVNCLKRNVSKNADTNGLHNSYPNSPSVDHVQICLLGNGNSNKLESKVHKNVKSVGQGVHESVLRRSPRFPTSSVTVEPQIVRKRPPKKAKVTNSIPLQEKSIINTDCFFVGDPIPEAEARDKWPHHYATKEKGNRGRSVTSKDDEDEYILDVKCHYYQASIAGCIFDMGDCAYVKSTEEKPHYVGRILEFFKTFEEEYYFTAQWFFRAEDTVLGEAAACHDKRRLFFSDLKNDNFLDCIISKVKVVQVPTSVNLTSKRIRECDFYYDMKYSLEYSSFCMFTDDKRCNPSLKVLNETIDKAVTNEFVNGLDMESYSERPELALLDLYSGCGGMSTGLCLGAQVAGLNLITRWTVDQNEAACKSVKLNHPEAQVRNESAVDFLELLKAWHMLCKRHLIHDCGKARVTRTSNASGSPRESHVKSEISDGEFEVLKLVDICYGDPTDTGKRGLKFKVRWKGYGLSEDTWEPIEGLSNCKDRIHDFVKQGSKLKILPLPGEVDVICGGPPCQGMSGLNRHRNVEAPLEDEKNKQIIVFMDVVQFLKPKYVLMENVIDILRFANGTLGRYALSRLVCMKYQARVGIMAAGCYGLPQFRLRTFFWGAHPDKMLPQFPLPTHDVVLKYGAPVEFERNVVAYDENQQRTLEKALVLGDAISDLPSVTSLETCDEISYDKSPQTEFQSFIRASKDVMHSPGSGPKKNLNLILYDHCSLKLGEENQIRVSQIPRRKGACFRDLPGILVHSDNSIELDPDMEREFLPSGRPLVPNYVFTFENGKSMRPFGRVWWDETVPTVLTTADPHFQAILHPEEDRVFTVRENARLQGFPDFYRFCGTIKERYCQIGNAVAVPVGRALGYSLGIAWKQKGPVEHEPLITLPPKFSLSHNPLQQPILSSPGKLECSAGSH